MDRPKRITFESNYSMDNNIAAICDLTEKYNAMTYLDEERALGPYGPRIGCIAKREGLMHRFDFMTGTLSKAYGVGGGYTTLCDFVRSFASEFVSTTALPLR